MNIQYRLTNVLLVIICLFLGYDGHALGVDSLPPNMYADSAYAPFYHGVASGDPLPQQVIIWTRITPDSFRASPKPVAYEVSPNQSFSQITASGTFTTDSMRDWTVKVDVTGLNPDTRYYYRFISPSQDTSRIGRTRTAPTGNVDHLRFGVVSCASVYSGYLNAYKRIGERDSLHALIHLGDYVYDFVDEDEKVRVPSPFPVNAKTKEEYRNRHAYYLLDPALRYARQQHPFITMWDNHDVNDTAAFEGTKKVFQEWVPMRIPDTTARERIYRTFNYGNLVDLIMIDILLFRNQDTHPQGDTSVLGLQQYNWLLDQLDSSKAKWRVIGNQKMMGGWSSKGLPSGLPVPTDGDVFDDSSWDGFQGERTRLFDYWEQNQIDNNIVLSGDAHISVAMDLTQDFMDSTKYNPQTGKGSVGVEFLPGSISRGNLDEQGIDPGLIGPAHEISNDLNPHHQYTEFTEHGYGILDITKDSATATYWYSNILQQTNQEQKAKSMVVMDSANHWKRQDTANTQVIDQTDQTKALQVYPNPSEEVLRIIIPQEKLGNGVLQICNITGKCEIEREVTKSKVSLDIGALQAGSYLVMYKNNDNLHVEKLIIH